MIQDKAVIQRKAGAVARLYASGQKRRKGPDIRVLADFKINGLDILKLMTKDQNDRYVVKGLRQLSNFLIIDCAFPQPAEFLT